MTELTRTRRDGCPPWCYGHLESETAPAESLSHFTPLVPVEGAPERWGSASVQVSGADMSLGRGTEVTISRHYTDRETVFVTLTLDQAANLAEVSDQVAPSLADAIRVVLALLAGPDVPTETPEGKS